MEVRQQQINNRNTQQLRFCVALLARPFLSLVRGVSCTLLPVRHYALVSTRPANAKLCYNVLFLTMSSSLDVTEERRPFYCKQPFNVCPLRERCTSTTASRNYQQTVSATVHIHFARGAPSIYRGGFSANFSTRWRATT